MLRVKRRGPYSYTKAPTKRPGRPLVDKARFAHVVEDGACCTECGWPVGSFGTLRSITSDGDRAFKHQICPSLGERARMRKELLEIA